MRRLSDILLVLVMVASVAFIAFLLILHGSDKEIWGPIAGLLAVIAAVIAAWPALRALALQEESLQPHPVPYFDLTSRYSLLQLRVQNFGPTAALDVQLRWREHPQNHKGEKITMLDEIPVLLPGHSVSTLIGVSHEFVRKYADVRFEGVVTFKNSAGKRKTDNFVCTTSGHRARLIHDEELPKTLCDLQKIPDHLERIAKLLDTRNDK